MRLWSVVGADNTKIECPDVLTGARLRLDCRLQCGPAIFRGNFFHPSSRFHHAALSPQYVSPEAQSLLLCVDVRRIARHHHIRIRRPS